MLTLGALLPGCQSDKEKGKGIHSFSLSGQQTSVCHSPDHKLQLVVN